LRVVARRLAALAAAASEAAYEVPTKDLDDNKLTNAQVLVELVEETAGDLLSIVDRELDAAERAAVRR
jgi:hypothetical protein